MRRAVFLLDDCGNGVAREANLHAIYNHYGRSSAREDGSSVLRPFQAGDHRNPTFGSTDITEVSTYGDVWVPSRIHGFERGCVCLGEKARRI